MALALSDPLAGIDRERVGRIGLLAQFEEVTVILFRTVDGADGLLRAAQVIVDRREIAQARGVGEERVCSLAAPIEAAVPFFLGLRRLPRRGEGFREQDVTCP